MHKQPFLGPSGTINIPFIEAATVRAADAFQDQPVVGIPGTRTTTKALGERLGGGTGRLFDAAGRWRGCFDPSLRQGY